MSTMPGPKNTCITNNPQICLKAREGKDTMVGGCAISWVEQRDCEDACDASQCPSV